MPGSCRHRVGAYLCIVEEWWDALHHKLVACRCRVVELATAAAVACNCKLLQLCWVDSAEQASLFDQGPLALLSARVGLFLAALAVEGRFAMGHCSHVNHCLALECCVFVKYYQAVCWQLLLAAHSAATVHGLPITECFLVVCLRFVYHLGALCPVFATVSIVLSYAASRLSHTVVRQRSLL